MHQIVSRQDFERQQEARVAAEIAKAGYKAFRFDDSPAAGMMPPWQPHFRRKFAVKHCLCQIRPYPTRDVVSSPFHPDGDGGEGKTYLKIATSSVRKISPCEPRDGSWANPPQRWSDSRDHAFRGRRPA